MEMDNKANMKIKSNMKNWNEVSQQKKKKKKKKEEELKWKFSNVITTKKRGL